MYCVEDSNNTSGEVNDMIFLNEQILVNSQLTTKYNLSSNSFGIYGIHEKNNICNFKTEALDSNI